MKLTNYKILQLSLRNIVRSIKEQKLKDIHKPPLTKDIRVPKTTKKNND